MKIFYISREGVVDSSLGKLLSSLKGINELAGTMPMFIDPGSPGG